MTKYAIVDFKVGTDLKFRVNRELYGNDGEIVEKVEVATFDTEEEAKEAIEGLPQ